MLEGVALCLNARAVAEARLHKVLTGGTGHGKDDVYTLYDIDRLSITPEERFTELFTYVSIQSHAFRYDG